MKRIDVYKLQRYAALSISIFLVAFFALELFFSLRWRMQHDTPVLHYIAYLIDRHGFVPYRDIYEQSMPGIYLFHLLIGKTLGYGDLAFQVVNVTYTLLTIAATWVLLKPFGKIAASTSAVFFGLIYLSFGPKIVLQRDYVGILPLILALIIVFRDDLIPHRYFRMLLVGAAIGLAVSIKPQLGICLPFLILYEAFKIPFSFKSFSGVIFQSGIMAGIGMLAVCLIPILWLWRMGSLPYFWDIFKNYLPLYLHVNGDHIVHVGIDRWSYILKNYLGFGGISSLFLCVCFGIYYVFFIEQRIAQKKLGMLLCSLGIAYSLYPILSGKFWEYHWMPFYYFASLWTGILLDPELMQSNKNALQGWLAQRFHRIQEGGTAVFLVSRQFIFFVIFLVISFTALRPSENFMLQIQGQKPAPIMRADLVTDFLKLRMKPGDTVQPLDSVLGDIIQGMLVSDAIIATPFIYDYQFYHDVSNPYIQNLRVEFIQKLNQSNPRFIIEYLNRPIPAGLNASNVFPELEQFINQSYKIIYQKNKIRIYIRK